MPILGNLGYVNYAITAIVGTLFAVSGFGGMTFGTLIVFLQYSRQFSMPIGQMSQQINSILMALAGAERILRLSTANPKRTTVTSLSSMPRRTKTATSSSPTNTRDSGRGNIITKRKERPRTSNGRAKSSSKT